jgi:hypothetical protein
LFQPTLKHDSLFLSQRDYGSEIWIADHKINIENLHNLSFEKTQNMIMKHILGVHGQTPNLAIHAEIMNHVLTLA